MGVRKTLALRVRFMLWITTQTLHGVVFGDSSGGQEGCFCRARTQDTICSCIVKPWESSNAHLTSGPYVTARRELWQKH